jgi:hypothetical protein
VPGYAHTPQAALAMLQALSARGAVLDATLTAHIRWLAESG